MKRSDFGFSSSAFARLCRASAIAPAFVWIRAATSQRRQSSWSGRGRSRSSRGLRRCARRAPRRARAADRETPPTAGCSGPTLPGRWPRRGCRKSTASWLRRTSIVASNGIASARISPNATAAAATRRSGRFLGRRASSASGAVSSGSVAGPASRPSARTATSETAVSSHIQSMPASKRKAATRAKSAATAARSLSVRAAEAPSACNEARDDERHEEREARRGRARRVSRGRASARLARKSARMPCSAHHASYEPAPRPIDRLLSNSSTADVQNCQRPLPLVEKRCSCTDAPVSSGGISLKFVVPLHRIGGGHGGEGDYDEHGRERRRDVPARARRRGHDASRGGRRRAGGDAAGAREQGCASPLALRSGC